MKTPCDPPMPLRARYAALPQFAFLLLVSLCLWASPARAQVTAGAVVSPTAPTYVDPVMVQVAVNSGTAPTGNITYSVDGGTANSSPVTNRMALLSLGRFALGSHTLSYQFQGTPANTTLQTTTFTVSDLPLALLWSKLNTISNHSGWGDGAPDVNNNMLVTNTSEGKLYRLDAMHNLTVVPTTGIAAPVGIATDSAGNAYIADSTSNTIVSLTAAGQQSTLAITGLLTPTYLALDPTGTYLYVNDSGHSRIVRYTVATSTLTEVVTAIDRIQGIATDATGRLYFGQRASYQAGGLFRVESNGTVTGPYYGLNDPEMLHADSLGNLFVADGYDGMERFDTAGHRTWIDGNYASPIGIDRLNVAFSFGIYGYTYPPGPVAQVDATIATGPNSTGSLVYSVPSGSSVVSLDTTNGFGNLINLQGGIGCGVFACSAGDEFGPVVPGLHSGTVTAKLNTGATVTTTFFGVGLNSNEAFDPGVQTTAPTQLTSGGGVAEFEDGTLFVSDTLANRVYSVPAAGGAPVDLNLTGLSGPTQVAVDGAKTVYVLDHGNDRVIAKTVGGQQSTIYTAGAGALSTLTALATDGSGALYLGGTYGSTGPAVVKLEVTGQLRLIQKTAAEPTAITLDGLGDIWEVEGSSGLLRKLIDHGFSAAVTMTDVAKGLQSVSAMSADPSGTVFVAEGTTGTVLAVRPDGSTFTVYSGLGNASALVVDGRSVLHTIDSMSNMLLTDDRRTTVFAFGNQVVGTTSAPQQRLLSNDGNLVLSGIGGLPGDNTFVIDQSSAQACMAAVPNTGTQLPLGSFCTITFRFKPSYAGAFNETGYEGDSTPTFNSTGTTRALSFTGTGLQGAVASLTPATVNFGSATAGTTTPAELLTLQNTGSTALNIASVAASGSGFQITANTCGSTLAASSSCTIAVVFAPTTASAVTGAITVTDDAVNGTTQTSALSGTGVVTVPSATLTPATQDFGSLNVGVGSSTEVFTLTNTGSAALNLQSISVSGPDASSFVTTGGGSCSTAQHLLVARAASLSAMHKVSGAHPELAVPSGVSCTVTIRFTASHAGPSSATLSITDDAGTQTSALTGNGIASTTPGASLTPATQDFGSLAVGVASSTQTFSLASTGTAPLNLQTIGITGSDASSFAVTGGSCSTAQHPAMRPTSVMLRNAAPARPELAVAAGATCTVTVVFTPSRAGALSAMLSVADDAGTQTSQLTGTGTMAVVTMPQAALTPAVASFGTVTVGGSGATQAFTLTNSGSAVLAITSATITGANAASFSLSGNTCTTTLAAGATCAYSVTFNPTVAGTATATLSVVDAVGTQTASLSGTANVVITIPADFTIAATPVAQTGSRGGSIVYTVQLQSVDPANPFTNTVALSVAGLPAGASAAFSPASLAPGTAQATASRMTVVVPVLTAQAVPPHFKPICAWLLAPLGLLAGTSGRRTRTRLLLLLGLFGITTVIVGCGSGTGFALPASTSTLTISGVSGSTTHTTAVTLTVR